MRALPSTVAHGLRRPGQRLARAATFARKLSNAARVCYVNGAYVPEHEATISVFDRGFLMADAVYEVTSVVHGKLLDFDAHCARLSRSLSELEISEPCETAELLEIHRNLVARNSVQEGLVYLQVSRGACDRDFAIDTDLTPSLVLFTQTKNLVDAPSARAGLRVITVDDLRWQRRDIKTVQLLAPSLAKTRARRSGADDAWMVEDGFVTEGTSNNAYIITGDGRIITRQLSTSLLHGITRASVLRLAKEAEMCVEERPFSVAEAQAAQEAFCTSATSFVTPVIEINGVPVGAGVPGPMTRRLREIYIEAAVAAAV